MPSFQLDCRQRVLTRDGEIVRLTPKAFDLLAALAARTGEVVSKEQLVDAVWPDTHVEEANLAKLIFTIRKELGDAVIETVPKRGYRFLGFPAEDVPVPPVPVPDPVPLPVHRFRWLPLAAVALLILASGAVWWFRMNLTVPPRPYLVVIPFEAAGGTEEAFARGLSEFIGARLSTMRGMTVLQPVSKSREPRRLARELGATLMLKGTVRRTGERTRVTYVLVSTKDQSTVGAEALTADSTDIFELEERVAARVASLLHIQQSLERENDPALKTAPQQRAYVSALGLLSRDSHLEAGEALALLEPLRASESPLVLSAIGSARLIRFRDSRDPRELDLAESFASRAAKLNRGTARVHALLGSIHRARGAFDRAIVELNTALQREPDAVDVLLDLAAVYRRMQRDADAERTFQSLIQTHPDCALCVNQYGYFHSTRGRTEEASKLYARAVALDPENPRFLVSLGGHYLKSGRLAEASPLFEKAIALQPAPGAYSNLGYTHYLSGDFVRAAEQFEHATRLEPRSFSYWGNLGDALLMQADLPAAESAYRRAISIARDELRIDPSRSQVRAMVAEYLAKVGDGRAARVEIERALASAPRDADVLLSASLVELHARREETAVAFIERATAAGLSPLMFRNDPQFTPLRTNERFVRVVALK
ncbi:MAG TPA: tetratricopeptide repeat protein [Thermoanaerobaculia bacterium]|jgi:tetratricopeptide (TPR) repeat protein/TolB-like protein